MEYKRKHKETYHTLQAKLNVSYMTVRRLCAYSAKEIGSLTVETVSKVKDITNIDLLDFYQKNK